MDLGKSNNWHSILALFWSGHYHKCPFEALKKGFGKGFPLWVPNKLFMSTVKKMHDLESNRISVYWNISRVPL